MVAAMQQQQQERVPAMKVPRQVLDAFDGLVVNDDKKRTAAAMAIVQHVDLALREGQGKELPAGVRYIVQRLASGLASTRLCAREGYFSALSLLLRHHLSAFSPAFVQSLLTKKSAAMKALTKDEVRNQLVAELLLCGALVRSGYASRCPEVLQCVVNLLCAMRTKKSYMDVTATQFLVNLMESCEGDSMHREVWESLQSELEGPVSELTPSQLWLRLVLLRKHRKDTPVWLTSTLTPKNHEALAQTIMKVITDLPEVHPVLAELVSSLAAASSSLLLIKFWGVTLELLQGHTSPGKLQIIFHLLRFILPHLSTAAELKAVVTASVVAMLLSSLSQPVRDLKEAAKGVTAALIQLVKNNQDEDSDLQWLVVQTLITSPGSVRFDQLTGHKVLAVMIPNFTLKTLKATANTLMEVVNKPKTAKDSEMADRNYAAHTLGNLLSQPRACVAGAAEWKKQQLAAVLKAVLLNPRKEMEGDSTKDAFFKALGKQVGHIKEYRSILMNLVEEVQKELAAGAGQSGDASSSSLSDKGKEQWSRVYGRLMFLRRKEYEEDTEQDVAKTIFQVLYCQMALHLFVDVPVATQSINEFIDCHKDVKRLGLLDNDDDDQAEEEEEEELNKEEPGEEERSHTWVEVVTEMLLSLMTQEMHLFRSVVQGLFWLLTPLMTAAALSLLTDVLDSDKARELLKKDDGEEEKMEEDEDEEGEEEDSDDDDEEDDDDSADDKEMDVGDQDLFTLKKKMLETTGDIDVDVDMDSVPQEELDRLDESLGALLAEYRGKYPGKKKKKKKKGKSSGGDDRLQLTSEELSLMHFQTKVCDMLAVYIKAAPNMALQVGLVLPLFEALRSSDLDARQKDLQNKLVNVITALEKKKKFNTIGDITVDSWKETVNEFFSVACKVPERFLSVIQSCYSQLMHCGRLLLGQEEGAVMRQDNFLTTIYIAHLETFFTRNHQLPKVQPFSEPCTYTIGGLWQVAAALVHHAFDPQVKVHKQGQALWVLQRLYTNKALVVERAGGDAAVVEQDLYGKVMKALESVQPPINGMYVSSLFRLLHTILQVDKRAEPQPSLDWGAAHVRVEALRERISKAALKTFRREYNVFTEALRGMLSSKHAQKQKKGVKRGAEETNEGGNRMKRRKNKTSKSVTEGGKGVEERNRQNPHKGKTVRGKDTENAAEGTKEGNSGGVLVNGGDTQGNEGDGKTKKKKRKGKLAKAAADGEKNLSAPTQKGNTEQKKKKKKVKTGPKSEDNQNGDRRGGGEEEANEAKKKNKKRIVKKRQQNGGEKTGTRGGGGGGRQDTCLSPSTAKPPIKKKTTNTTVKSGTA